MISLDPPVPPDGSCAECGGQRRVSGLSPVYLREAERDPFCKAECARVWHDVPAPASQQLKPRGYVSKLPPVAWGRTLAA